MQGKRILIAGCGKIGLRLARQLAKKHAVCGLKRKPLDTGDSIPFIQADLTNKGALASAFKTSVLKNNVAKDFDYLIYCLAPTERTEQAYRNIYINGLQNLLSSLPSQESLKRIYFISSTSVYHQDDDSWVNENSPTLPTRFPGEILLEAEEFLNRVPIASTCIRFSGIYGGARSRLIDEIKGHEIFLSPDKRISNRIHEDDCVAFLVHLIQQDINGSTSQPLYIATDSAPVDLNEVLMWIAEQFNIPLSISKDVATTRRSGNKYCCNKRMLETGYTLQFPSYKEGYMAMINNEVLVNE